MDKYLLELLKEVNTIIIPGLGALTITNTDTGEIMFMSYLKHDDGKLSSHIAAKEGMDENEAKNLIAKYVRDILARLDQGESYDMFQFGSFYKNEEGEVDFKNWEGTTGAPQTEEKKEEKIDTPVVVEEEKEEPKQEKEVEPEEQIVEEEKVEKEEPKKEEEKKVEETPVKEEKPIVVAEENKEKELNIEEKEELDKNVQKLEKLKADKEAPKKKKKRSPAFWMLMVVIVLLGAGTTYVIIDYDNFKQHVPFLADKEEPVEGKSEIDKMKEMMGVSDEEEAERIEESEVPTEEVMEEESANMESDEQSAEEIIEQEEQIEESVEEIKEEPEQVKTEPTRVASSGSFHIIAGAFSSPENADRLAESFRQQGFSSAKVGMVNGLNMVSIRSFPSKEEAESALPSVQPVAPKAWVYHGDL